MHRIIKAGLTTVAAAALVALPSAAIAGKGDNGGGNGPRCEENRSDTATANTNRSETGTANMCPNDRRP